MKNINKFGVIFLLVIMVGLQTKLAFSQTIDKGNNVENQEKCPHHQNNEMINNPSQINGNQEMRRENYPSCKNYEIMNNNHENHGNHENHENHKTNHNNPQPLSTN